MPRTKNVSTRTPVKDLHVKLGSCMKKRDLGKCADVVESIYHGPGKSSPLPKELHAGLRKIAQQFEDEFDDVDLKRMALQLIGNSKRRAKFKVGQKVKFKNDPEASGPIAEVDQQDDGENWYRVNLGVGSGEWAEESELKATRNTLNASVKSPPRSSSKNNPFDADVYDVGTKKFGVGKFFEVVGTARTYKGAERFIWDRNNKGVRKLENFWNLPKGAKVFRLVPGTLKKTRKEVQKKSLSNTELEALILKTLKKHQGKKSIQGWRLSMFLPRKQGVKKPDYDEIMAAVASMIRKGLISEDEDDVLSVNNIKLNSAVKARRPEPQLKGVSTMKRKHVINSLCTNSGGMFTKADRSTLAKLSNNELKDFYLSFVANEGDPTPTPKVKPEDQKSDDENLYTNEDEDVDLEDDLDMEANEDDMDDLDMEENMDLEDNMEGDLDDGRMDDMEGNMDDEDELETMGRGKRSCNRRRVRNRRRSIARNRLSRADQETLNWARQERARQRKSLVSQILNSCGNQADRRDMITVVKSMNFNQLQAMARTRGAQEVNYTGQPGGHDLSNNSDNDVLPLPTINWDKDA